MKENVFNKIKGINEFIYKYNIHIIVLGILILFFGLSISNQKYNIILTIILLIWIYNILYSIINLKKRFLYLIMNLMLFTFVLSRPTLNLIRGNSVWYFSDIVIQKTLLSIGIAEIFLAIGNYIAEGKLIIKIQEYVKRIFSFRQDKRAPKIENENYYINNVLIVLLVISGTANIFMSILNYINMKNQDYALIYTSGVQKFPFVLRNIAAIFPFSIKATQSGKLTIKVFVSLLPSNNDVHFVNSTQSVKTGKTRLVLFLGSGNAGKDIVESFLITTFPFSLSLSPFKNIGVTK